MTSVTSHCPHWCSRDHFANASGAAFYHASEAASVAIAQPGGGLAAPDRLDVQTAQYLPDDPDEPATSPTVELAVHAGGRYRLIGLTPDEARELAALLARAADITSASVAVLATGGRTLKAPLASPEADRESG